MDKPSVFLRPERITIGVAVHCVACRERLTLLHGRFFHGTVAFPHNCPKLLINIKPVASTKLGGAKGCLGLTDICYLP